MSNKQIQCKYYIITHTKKPRLIPNAEIVSLIFKSNELHDSPNLFLKVKYFEHFVSLLRPNPNLNYANNISELSSKLLRCSNRFVYSFYHLTIIYKTQIKSPYLLVDADRYRFISRQIVYASVSQPVGRGQL